MKQKVLLGLFVSLPFVCTIPVFAAGNIPCNEYRPYPRCDNGKS